MKKFISSQPFTLSALTLSLLSSLSALAAPIPPDAGQTIRELQKQPELTAPKADAPLQIESEGAAKGVGSTAVRIAVKAIHVTGNSVFTTSELEALVADLVGGEHSLAELDAGAARITAFYRERGYVVARAYLPEQEIRDGSIAIKVMEGLLGEQRINNQSRLDDEYANGYLSGIKSGDAVHATPVDRALLLLSDTPGVGGTRATLQPGASVGTSDLIVELTPSAPYIANVELDNYGNRYTGEYRLGATMAVNSPLRIGDQLTVRALTSNQNLGYARLAYSIPLGSSGLRTGVAYSDTRYKLGQEFESLQAHGSANSSSVYAMYPFIRSQASNLSATLTLEDKRLKDQTDVPVSSVDKHVELSSLGLSGNRRDASGSGLNSFELTMVSGSLSMDAASQAADAVSAKSDGAFTRFTYSLSRLQRLSDSNTLSLAVSGQQASKNLNSSEKFSLGGAYGVRAYPQGEGSGDEGWLANLELRHNLGESLQGVVFYDTGSVEINHNQYVTGAANTRDISGAGVGMNSSLASVQLKAYLAWRTTGGIPQSEPESAARNPRLWVQASKQF